MVSLAIFLLGMKRYRKHGPLGSPLTSVAQVLVAAARKWRVNETRDGCGAFHGDERDGPNRAGNSKARTMARTNQLRYVSFQWVLYSYCSMVQRRKKRKKEKKDFLIGLTKLNFLSELLVIMTINMRVLMRLTCPSKCVSSPKFALVDEPHIISFTFILQIVSNLDKVHKLWRYVLKKN